MTALARVESNLFSGSFLPVPVVVEFGLNNVNPPPDTIEEEHTSTSVSETKKSESATSR